MTTNKFTTLLSIFLVSVLSLTKTNAAIIAVAPTAVSTGSLQVTNEISFTLSTAIDSTALVFMFDEWVASDGSQTSSDLIEHFALTIDEGPIFEYDNAFYRDNLATNLGAGTPNDGYIVVASEFALSAGTIVTVLARTYTIAATADSNPLATQTFSGNMFLVDDAGNQISDLVVVPELKTTALLSGVFALFFVVTRRSKNMIPRSA